MYLCIYSTPGDKMTTDRLAPFMCDHLSLITTLSQLTVYPPSSKWEGMGSICIRDRAKLVS